MKEEQFPGELDMIALNTLIPRRTRERLNLVMGYEQAKRPGLRVSLQYTVNYLLERATQDYFDKLEALDSDFVLKTDVKMAIAAHEKELSELKVKDEIKARRESSGRTIDPKDYEAMSNPSPGYGKFRY